LWDTHHNRAPGLRKACEQTDQPVAALGLAHEELVFERNGIKEKLTSVFSARIIDEILA
jgi:hypothetical protein